MGAVWYLLRVGKARTVRSIAGLALIAGVGGGMALGAAAGADRTGSAFERLRNTSVAADALVSVERSGLDGFYDEVVALPEVVGGGALLALNAYVSDPPVAEDFHFPGPFGSVSGTYGRDIDRPLLLAGRMWDPASTDEATVNERFANETGLGVGDRVTMVPTPDRGPELDPISVRVVGIVRTVTEAAPLTVFDQMPQMFVGPEATRRLFDPRAHAFDGLAVRVVPGTDMGRLQATLERMARNTPETGGTVFFTSESARPAAAARMVRPFVLALVVLAVVLGLTTALLTAQLASRQSWLTIADDRILRRLGLGAQQLLARAALRLTFAGAIAGAIGAMIAVASSAWMPLGPSRLAEPNPGLVVDGVWVLGGAAMLFAGVIALGALPAWRAIRRGEERRPRGSILAGLGRGLGPSAASGLRFAFDPGSGDQVVPVRATIITMVFALAAVAGASAFGESLLGLVREPVLYGQAWDLTVDAQFGELPSEVVAEVRSSEAVDGVSAGVYGSVQINGQPVPSVGIDVFRGGVYPTMTAGRPAMASDEVVLGARTMRELGVGLGDEVDVRTADVTVSSTVVGRAVFPRLGQGGFNPTSLGEGAALTTAAVEGATTDAYSFLLLDLADTPAGAAFGRGLQAFCDRVSRSSNDLCLSGISVVPLEVDQYAQVRDVPRVLTVLLGGLAVVTLAHLLASSVRRRRGALAILRTLGFSRRQLSATVGWQATAMVVAAMVIALPAGVALGRVLWRVFAEQLGVVVAPATPVAITASIAGASLLVANGVAAFPARSAGRTRPAAVLRSE